MPASLRPHLAIFGLMLVLLLPALLSPPMLRDSFWIDWVWSDQFTAELARGNLYPRWLPLANGGAGSPTFYFYPPLSFYVSGLFGLAGLSTYASIIACFAVALLLSGYAMFAWLQDTPRPLLGALLFMAAPYHLLDFYGRGAQAECLAIGFLPLVMLGLRRVAEKSSPTLLAFSYAGLILAHLPLALLASVFMIAPYCLWKGNIRLFVLPLALGVAMAAVYLLPALALNHFRHSELLSADPQFQPTSWSLLFPKPGPVGGMRTVFATLLAASLIPAAILWRAGQRKVGLYVMACGVIAAGLIPGLWALPLLRDVQFPFRMMPLIDFALATSIASAALSERMTLLAASPTLVLTPVFVLVHQQERVPSMVHLAAYHPDVPENQLVRTGPLPLWPEQVGLLVSLTALALLVALSLRSARGLRRAAAASSR
jgi:hypothetical protein